MITIPNNDIYSHPLAFVQPIPKTKATPQTIQIPRHQRQQLIVLDLIEATVMFLPPKTPSKTREASKRIIKRIDNIIGIINPKRDPTQIPRQHRRKHYRALDSAKHLILEQFETKINMNIMYNATLRLVYVILDGIPDNKYNELRREWKALNKSLCTFYSHFDPQLKHDDFMENGDKFAGKIWDVIRAA